MEEDAKTFLSSLELQTTDVFYERTRAVMTRAYEEVDSNDRAEYYRMALSYFAGCRN